MRDGLLRLLQLALAALISAAAGGLILPVLLVLASMATGGAAGGGSDTPIAGLPVLLGIVIFGSGLAMVLAVSAGWLPAFVAGAALWEVGRSRDWARRRLAWALAGAAVALICYLRAFPPGGPDPSGGPFSLPQAAVAALFMVAGAAAGQLYRSAMPAIAPFFGFDEQSETG